MKHFLIILTVFLVLGCRDSSSIDNSPILPPETQTGVNTFGCTVNGRLFYPRDGIPNVGSNPKGVEFSALGNYPDYIYNELTVNNYKDGKPVNFSTMHFVNLKQIGEYSWKQTNFKTGIDGVNENYFLVRAFDYSENVWKWYGSYESSGKTVIAKYENGVFSGTFSGKLKTEDGKSEIEITNGRFDFNLFTLPVKEWP